MAEHFPDERPKDQSDNPWFPVKQSGVIVPTLQPVGFSGLSDAARAGNDANPQGWNNWEKVFAPGSPKAKITMEGEGAGGNPEKASETVTAPCWGCWFLRILLLLLLAWAIDKVSSDD